MGSARLAKNILKKKAREEWKKKIKDDKISKRYRMPFSQFFKEYVKNNGAGLSVVASEGGQEDFSFEDYITVNDVDSDNLEE